MELEVRDRDKKQSLKAFIPIGIAFVGAGVTYIVAVNAGVGAGLIAVGVAFMIGGARRSKD
jgi:hypothetical protein